VFVPPRGYLERLAAICARHDILLIFDEVITAFGRLGAPFAAEVFGVVPDLITTAKGITNGAVPMGAVFVHTKVHAGFMHGPEAAIELSHGYTYSGHPLASAAAIATLETLQKEGLMTRAASLSPYWEERVHRLAGLPHVIDIRNIGLIAAIEFAPLEGAPGQRAHARFLEAFQRGILVRATGDVIALAPPLIITEPQIDELIDVLAGVLCSVTD
jgi:beta-alanine--pyruvate transaminase